jgi:hypothetical protein
MTIHGAEEQSSALFQAPLSLAARDHEHSTLQLRSDLSRASPHLSIECRTLRTLATSPQADSSLLASTMAPEVEVAAKSLLFTLAGGEHRASPSPRSTYAWAEADTCLAASPPHGQSRQTVYDECGHVVTGEGGEEGRPRVGCHA